MWYFGVILASLVVTLFMSIAISTLKVNPDAEKGVTSAMFVTLGLVLLWSFTYSDLVRIFE